VSGKDLPAWTGDGRNRPFCLTPTSFICNIVDEPTRSRLSRRQMKTETSIRPPRVPPFCLNSVPSCRAGRRDSAEQSQFPPDGTGPGGRGAGAAARTKPIAGGAGGTRPQGRGAGLLRRTKPIRRVWRAKQTHLSDGAGRPSPAPRPSSLRPFPGSIVGNKPNCRWHEWDTSSLREGGYERCSSEGARKNKANFGDSVRFEEGNVKWAGPGGRPSEPCNFTLETSSSAEGRSCETKPIGPAERWWAEPTLRDSWAGRPCYGDPARETKSKGSGQ
jgi:hypothetical protein